MEYDYLADLLPIMTATGESVHETAAREKAEIQAEHAARKAKEAANRCPRCMGSGRLPQFSHRKAGECFTCGGSGLFSRYAA